MNKHTKSKADGGDGLAEAPTRPQFVVLAHEGRAVIGVAGGSDVVAIVEPNYLEYAPQFAAAPDLLNALDDLVSKTEPLELAYGTKEFVAKLDAARASSHRASAVVKKARGQ